MRREQRARHLPGARFPTNYLGQLNMFTGHITPVPVRGAALHPQGLIFVAY